LLPLRRKSDFDVVVVGVVHVVGVSFSVAQYLNVTCGKDKGWPSNVNTATTTELSMHRIKADQ